MSQNKNQKENPEDQKAPEQIPPKPKRLSRYEAPHTYSSDELAACCATIIKTPAAYPLTQWQKNKVGTAKALINAGHDDFFIRKTTLLSTHIIQLIRAGAYQDIT